MRRPALRLLPLCLAMACAARAQEAAPAVTGWERCPTAGTLPLHHPVDPNPPAREGAATDVSAENLDVSESEVTVLTGDVQLRRADQWLGTDQLTWDHAQGRFRTQGPVKYQDQHLRLQAESAEGLADSDEMRLRGVQYQFNDNAGNGSADDVLVRGEEGTLSGGTYSTCPPGARQWEFAATRITVDQAEGMGTARNATLRLGGVPILWLPWVRFPTDDRRRTGLLAPTLGYDDRNGFEYEQPIYLNLAPNYDATLKPRWIGERGLMLGGEFRYLTERSAGTFEGGWLPDDDLDGRDRGWARWTHGTRLGEHWFAQANLNHVSDREYYSDFGDSLSTTTISLVESTAGLYGRGLYWSASLAAQDWRIANPLLAEGSEPYRRLPTAQLRWDQPFGRHLEAGIEAEAVRFDGRDRPGGERVDLQPFVRFPMGGAAWFATPKLAWRYTAYSLDDSLVPPGGDASPDRSLPVMSLDMGAFFERAFTLGGGQHVQTLEPRLFYLYVPYRDQDALPLFDTQALSFSWPGLFRENRFAGGDRQGDANQATFALTSRVLDGNDGHERMSFSLGRIHYFEAPRVTVPGAPALSDEGSAWIAEASVALGRRWSLGLVQQWDPDSERTALSAIRSQWRFGEGGLVNAAYRYRAGLLEQTDLSFVLPIRRDWRLVGRWNYSLRDRQSLEALAGVEWSSCCVAVRVLGRRYVREFSGEQNTGIYLEVELNGVGSFGRSTARLLDDAILDYSR